LANAEGDILDNIALIENLEDSKRISIEVGIKVEIAKKKLKSKSMNPLRLIDKLLIEVH